MPANKEQYQQVQEAAIQLVASIGIERLDSMALNASATIKRGLAKQLAADKQVTMQTARLHITKACRRLRNPDYQPAIQWGGDRRSEDFRKHSD